MKSLLFATILLAGSAASAQQPVIRKLSADTTGLEYYRKLYSTPMVQQVFPQATYSHTTSKGKVYTLPVDNMPCLAPDMKQVARMPVQQLPESNMPNAFPKQRIIPEEKKDQKK